MIDLVRGTKDLFGINLLKHKLIIKTAEQLAKKYNFQELQTPIIEKASLFTKALEQGTDVLDKEIYAFQDKGGEFLALRPEFTAPVMRHIINIGFNSNQPYKLFSYGPLFRYDRPQAGRQRQFSQLNFEIFGAKSIFYDAEIISLAKQILDELNIPNFKIAINYLGKTETKLKYQQILFKFFDTYKSDLSILSQTRLEKSPLRILDSKDEKDRKIILNAPTIEQVFDENDIKNFEELQNLLQVLKIDYFWDKHLVRGLSYYTGTIFEFLTDEIGAQSALLGGGRYDDLYANMGGKSINNQGLSAVGFAAGIERLSLVMHKNNFKKDLKIYILPLSEEENLESLLLATNLRKMTNFVIETLILNINLKKKLEIVAKCDGDYAIILGSEEIKSQNFSVRNMHTKETNKLSLDNIINISEF